jgi:histidine triad (HIT) family protein
MTYPSAQKVQDTPNSNSGGEELRGVSPIADLENIKKKLLEQINSQYEPEKAKAFTEKINEMNDDQFIDFLKKQGLLNENGEQKQQCIFCSMIDGSIPTTKIAENDDAIAILEINPISKGHTLIIPKKHIETEKDFPKSTKDFTLKLAEELKSAFKPQRVDLEGANVMGHQALNLIPVYSNETINSPRYQETPEGLKKLKEEFENTKPTTIPEKNPPQVIEKPKEEKKEIKKEKLWLRPKIP